MDLWIPFVPSLHASHHFGDSSLFGDPRRSVFRFCAVILPSSLSPVGQVIYVVHDSVRAPSLYSLTESCVRSAYINVGMLSGIQVIVFWDETDSVRCRALSLPIV